MKDEAARPAVDGDIRLVSVERGELGTYLLMQATHEILP